MNENMPNPETTSRPESPIHSEAPRPRGGRPPRGTAGRMMTPARTGAAAGADTADGRVPAVRARGDAPVREARRNAAGFPAARCAGSVWIMSITSISRITACCGNS